MKKLFTIAILMLAVKIMAQTQLLTNFLNGNVASFNLTGRTNLSVKMELLSPKNRTISGVFISNDPILTCSDTNGNFTFTNVQWGSYRLSVGDSYGSYWYPYVGTNTIGSWNLAALSTNSAAIPPNPGTNYYTMAQVDALISGISGGGTNGGIVYNFSTAFSVNSGTNVDVNGSVIAAVVVSNGVATIQYVNAATSGLLQSGIGGRRDYGGASGPTNAPFIKTMTVSGGTVAFSQNPDGSTNAAVTVTGGGGSQTPLAQDVNAAGFSGTNYNQVTAKSFTQTNSGQSVSITNGNVTASATITANAVAGNGSGLTSITGANVTGTVPSATTAVSATTATAALSLTTSNYFQFNTNFETINTRFVLAGFGNDSWPGDINQPWATVTNACAKTPTGWTIAVGPGTYIGSVSNGLQNWYLCTGARVLFNHIHDAPNFIIKGDGWVDWFCDKNQIIQDYSNCVANITCDTFNELSPNPANLPPYQSETSFGDGTNSYTIHCRLAQLSMIDNYGTSSNYFYVKADEVWESNDLITGHQRHDVYCNNLTWVELGDDPFTISSDSRIFATHSIFSTEDNGLIAGNTLNWIWGIQYLDNSGAGATGFAFGPNMVFVSTPIVYDPSHLTAFDAGITTPYFVYP